MAVLDVSLELVFALPGLRAARSDDTPEHDAAPPPIFARARRYPMAGRHREITDGSDRRCGFLNEMLGHTAILKNLGGSDELRQV